MRIHRPVRSLAALAIVSLLALLASDARGMFMAPTGVPVDRLVANITQYVAEHPDDANARYLLGRVHALAYRYDRSIVGAFAHRQPKEQGGLPQVAEDFMQGWVRPEPQPAPEPQVEPVPDADAPAPAPARAAAPAPGGQPVKPEDLKLTDEQKVLHLTAAVDNYIKAIAMNPEPAHYHLGLAYVLDKGRELAGSVPPPKVRTTPGEPTYEQAAKAYELLHTVGEDKPVQTLLLQRYWREAAIEKHLDAYNRAADKDAALRHQPVQGINSLVSFEAANAYVRLIKERDATEGEKQSVASVEKHLAHIKAIPVGAVTPIVFALDARRPLASMLSPDRVVRFDLDGDGVAERRPWVNPDTAILCWDPDRTGRITSGMQLFGSVTFHLYPDDGYVAMDMLDDNRDGELAGDELVGLALWFDRNSNGVCDPGEVVPIEKSPVAGLSVKPLTRDGDGPANPFGLRLHDGRVLPTYDWIAPAVE